MGQSEKHDVYSETDDMMIALKQSAIERLYFNTRTRHSVFGKMQKGDSMAQYAGASCMRSFESLRLRLCDGMWITNENGKAPKS